MFKFFDDFKNGLAVTPLKDTSLELFGVRRSPSTDEAILQLQQLMKKYALPAETIKFVDVMENLESCYQEEVFITPTLVVHHGDKKYRFVSEFEDSDQLREILSHL